MKKFEHESDLFTYLKNERNFEPSQISSAYNKAIEYNFETNRYYHSLETFEQSKRKRFESINGKDVNGNKVSAKIAFVYDGEIDVYMFVK